MPCYVTGSAIGDMELSLKEAREEAQRVTRLLCMLCEMLETHRRVMPKDELPRVQREHAVISTKLLAGRTVARVYGDSAGPGFEPAEPDLEDVYFSTMAGHNGRRRDQAVPPVVA